MSSIEEIKSNLKSEIEKVKHRAVDVLVIEVRKSIRQNFQSEGRPNTWAKKKKSDGRKILRGRTNRLFNTLNVIGDYNEGSVTASSNLPYSKIHQEGGTISRKPGTVRLRTVKIGEDKFGKRFASSKHVRNVKEVARKGYVITIQPRPFMVIPGEDFPRIVRNIQTAVNKIG